MQIVVTFAQDGGEEGHERFLGLAPVVIGRDPIDDRIFVRGADGAQTKFALSDPRVSRRHVTIDAGPEGLILTDHSTNGTDLADLASPRLTRDVSTAIGRAACGLEFCGYRFNVAAADLGQTRPVVQTLLLIVTSPKGREFRFEAADAALMLGVEDGRAYIRTDHSYRHDDEDVALIARDAGWVAILDEVNGRVSIRQRADTTLQPLVNRAELPLGERRSLRHRDAVDFFGHRIVVWDPTGGGAVVCPNTECRLLNPPGRDQNCRFCGAKLDTGQTYIVS